MTNPKGTARSLQQTAMFTKVISKLVTSMVMEFLCGRMGPGMRGNGGKDKFREEDAIDRQMGEAMRVSGGIT